MRSIALGEAKVGDVIAEPISNVQGRVTLPKGAKLSAAVLARLRGWGVHELAIEGDGPDEAEQSAGDTGALEEEDRFVVLFLDVTACHITEDIQPNARHYLEHVLRDISLGVAVLNEELPMEKFARVGQMSEGAQ